MKMYGKKHKHRQCRETPSPGFVDDGSAVEHKARNRTSRRNLLRRWKKRARRLWRRWVP